MTDAEKKAECEKICGEMGKRGIHSSAPIQCPYDRDALLNPKRRPQQ